MFSLTSKRRYSASCRPLDSGLEAESTTWLGQIDDCADGIGKRRWVFGEEVEAVTVDGEIESIDGGALDSNPVDWPRADVEAACRDSKSTVVDVDQHGGGFEIGALEPPSRMRHVVANLAMFSTSGT